MLPSILQRRNTFLLEKLTTQPLYINAFSNQSATITKQLPKMINRRISDLSCNMEEFDKVKSAYESALKDSGHFSWMPYNNSNTQTLAKIKTKEMTAIENVTTYWMVSLNVKYTKLYLQHPAAALFTMELLKGSSKHGITNQTSKLLQTTYHRRFTSKHVSSESKMQNWYVVRRIKSVFSKLALLLRVWQRNFFTKLVRRVKQRNSPFKKNKFTV